MRFKFFKGNILRDSGDLPSYAHDCGSYKHNITEKMMITVLSEHFVNNRLHMVDYEQLLYDITNEE